MSEITNQATADGVVALVAELQQTTTETTAAIEQGRSDVIAVVSAAGPIDFYHDYAQALEKSVALPDDSLFEILRDETQGHARTRYFKRAGGVFEFAVNLDQLRMDLDSERGAKIIQYRRSAVTNPIALSLLFGSQYVYLQEFGDIDEDGVGAADALQKAVDHAWTQSPPMGIWCGNTKMLLDKRIGLPDNIVQSPWDFCLFGNGAEIIVDIPDGSPVFVNAKRKAKPSELVDYHTSKFAMKGFTVKGSREVGSVFDGDSLYNTNIQFNSFSDLFVVAKSGYAKPDYPKGYFQSFSMSYNHFTNCGNGLNGGVMVGSMAFNSRFQNNACEAGNEGTIVRLDQGYNAGIYIEHNVHEGGARFAQLSNSIGSVKNNYFENNNRGVMATSHREIVIVDQALYAVPSTFEISGNIAFLHHGVAGKLIEYSGPLRVNTLTITNNQVRGDHSERDVYYSTTSRPGFYKNNSRTVNIVAAPDNGNTGFSVEGFAYKKAFCEYSPPAGVRYVVVRFNAPGVARIKVSTVIYDSDYSATAEYAVAGELVKTGSFRLEEVFKHDSPQAIAFDTPHKGVGYISIPVTLSASNGGMFHVEVEGTLFSGATGLGMGHTSGDIDAVTVLISE